MKKFFHTLACAVLALTMVVPAMAFVSPATGDEGIGVWVAIMAVAVVVLIGLLIVLAKKNKK